MTEPLVRPKRKNPLQRTRRPLSPQGIRSRTAHGLTAAAAEGRFALQVCEDCKTVIYPPRDCCPSCLSARLPFRDVSRGGALLAETTVHTSPEPYFRERMPWRVGTVKLDAGPVMVAHLHGDTREGDRVRLELKLDKSGSAVAIALPEQDTPNMADDPHLREMTCDPKFRRVLITDGRTPVGQAMARNPVPLIIPCHRVTAAGGRIGGFSAPGGSVSKARMLELEGVVLDAGAPSAGQLGFGF